MKAYALTALSAVAAIGLVIATPMLSRAAGFGAATGIRKSLAPSVDLAGCAVSIDPEHMALAVTLTPAWVTKPDFRGA